jgi:hypothetical protein
MAVLILLTSSFDIFLVVQAGGNYRFCQLATVLLTLLAVIRAVRGRRIPVLGSTPLMIWLLFQILFIPASTFWPKSVGYCLWLIVNLCLIFSFVQLFSNNIRSMITILRWYIYSFGLISIFGITQFLSPLLGFHGPLVQQWLIPDVLARVNGFSYEPSYFATYLLIGFVFIGALRRSGSMPFPAGRMLAIYCLTATGIILSSSRMGICFLLVDVFLSQMTPWLSFLKSLLRRRIAPFRVRALIPSFLVIASVGSAVAAVTVAITRSPVLVLMFLNGTGINDAAAHSVVQRENAAQDTLAVLWSHPIIGRSLGGVSAAIAERYGDAVQSFQDSKAYEGMNVFAEALAASGLIGIIPFAWFLVVSIARPLRLARISPPLYSTLLRALLRSLLFAWAILQFNQNMLRPYLWAHVAILAMVYAAALQSVAIPTAAFDLSHER